MFSENAYERAIVYLLTLWSVICVLVGIFACIQYFLHGMQDVDAQAIGLVLIVMLVVVCIGVPWKITDTLLWEEEWITLRLEETQHQKDYNEERKRVRAREHQAHLEKLKQEGIDSAQSYSHTDDMLVEMAIDIKMVRQNMLQGVPKDHDMVVSTLWKLETEIESLKQLPCENIPGHKEDG